MKGAENTGCVFPKLTGESGRVSLTQPDVQGIPSTKTCSRKSEGDLAAEHEVKARSTVAPRWWHCPESYRDEARHRQGRWEARMPSEVARARRPSPPGLLVLRGGRRRSPAAVSGYWPPHLPPLGTCSASPAPCPPTARSSSSRWGWPPPSGPSRCGAAEGRRLRCVARFPPWPPAPHVTCRTVTPTRPPPGPGRERRGGPVHVVPSRSRSSGQPSLCLRFKPQPLPY